MNRDKWSPWSLKPLWDVLQALIALFIGAIALLTLRAVPSLHAALPTKVFVVILAVSSIGGVISTLMWSRYWRQVDWETGFWSFISGPPPEYEEALRAWRWGRRCRVFWLLVLGSTVAIAILEVLAETG